MGYVNSLEGNICWWFCQPFPWQKVTLVRTVSEPTFKVTELPYGDEPSVSYDNIAGGKYFLGDLVCREKPMCFALVVCFWQRQKEHSKTTDLHCGWVVTMKKNLNVALFYSVYKLHISTNRCLPLPSLLLSSLQILEKTWRLGNSPPRRWQSSWWTDYDRHLCSPNAIFWAFHQFL